MYSQIQTAQHVYDVRAPDYEKSWHPDYTTRLMKLAPLHEGDKVLVPCCGTGLESFMAAEAVGPHGLVVGVDVSEGMLKEARARQSREAALAPRLRFIHHDAASLGTCTELGELEGKFDLLICSNAFVLFRDPAGVVRGWRGWVRDGGRMIIDIVHEKSFVPGVVIEKVMAQLGVAWPWNRAWARGRDSFKEILESEGMQVEVIELLNTKSEQPVLSYGVDEADEQFESVAESGFACNVRWQGDQRERAKDLFRKEWESIAVDGKVEAVNALYVYVARKI
ncbi:uncharacterized protein JN550_011393 [Neoarthrinium moseri]|uniref:uncharacterized protein n=1 Tax=Neoarthrinium moseri TaxID=1658444 RepID=UPI001FDBDA73|nr:uncharacterized protein JN550_011393 [Neoarthrinium moseri]KAI1860668.1 hypothetical protein JN550_011393 [Neoarthrinium moseri]